jgi:hypothetical protein
VDETPFIGAQNMGRTKRSKKTAAEPKRLAKMVTADTAALIDRFSDVLAEERDMQSRVSDNDTIRTAILEAFKTRGL